MNEFEVYFMKKKEIDSVLAIVNTTYQLLVILCLKDAFYKDRQMDLVLSNKTKGLRELCNNPLLLSMFPHIYYADATKIKNINKRSVQVLFESFIYNRTTGKILGEPLGSYGECLYASPIGVDEITKELSKNLIRNNAGIRFKKYEDGVGSYTQLKGWVVSTELGRFIYKKILGFDNQAQEKEIYLFEPEMAMNQSEYEMVKIPIKNLEIIKKASAIFGVNTISVKPKCIFFGQGTQEFVYDSSMYTSVIHMIAEIIGNDEIIVKKHPRGIWDDFENRYEFLNADYPWELLAGCEEMQDKILISFSSTACITGKLIFGTHNPVIFLYRLAGGCVYNENSIEPFFRKLEQRLSNVYIPETKEELSNILRYLISSNDGWVE